MGWANELYNVYDLALKLPKEETRTLLPISHSTANAQIEVTIDGSGNFMDACVVFDNRKKSKQGSAEDGVSDTAASPVTIIPVTEDSGARSSGIAPHPFADKLVYVAGDYSDYCDCKKDDPDKYKAYIKQLKEWNDSEFSHPSVKALYAYLSKGELIRDIARTGLFQVDGNRKLTNDKIEKIEQKDCFVRFSVNGESRERRTWLDKSLYDNFNGYLASRQTEKGFCYATGDEAAITYKHPSKILNAGDKGKLFSANDESGFTYKGRFLEKEQAFAVGYEFSQKMHNALKWLIETRGIFVGGMQIVAWSSTLTAVPDLCTDSEKLIGEACDCDDYGDYDDYEPGDETNAEGSSDSEILFANYKNALHRSVFGEKSELDYRQKIMVMILDEATTGRVSVGMYTELERSDFCGSIEKWHENTAWERFNPVTKKSFIGSYSLPRLADLAFGTEQNGLLKCPDELKRETIARLVPCVIEGRNLPKDILNNLVNRASKPLAYSSNGNWRNVLNAACGMIRKTKIEKGENCTMALDENCADRSYLFGRLLAVAEEMELAAYSPEDKKGRVPNARRYWERFSHSPAVTWNAIYERLIPYSNKLGNYNIFIKEINDIKAKFDVSTFAKKDKLDSLYLLGYSHQKSKPFGEYGKNNQQNNVHEEEN